MSAELRFCRTGSYGLRRRLMHPGGPGLIRYLARPNISPLRGGASAVCGASLLSNLQVLAYDESCLCGKFNYCELSDIGAPARTRTWNPRLRRPVLYPVELRALNRRVLYTK